MKILFTSIFSLLLSACATTHSSKLTFEEIAPSFSGGELRLTCGTSCAYRYGANRQNFLNLIRQGKQKDLAVEIVRIGYESDQAYLYLGYAAQALGLYRAAEIYYRLSLEAPKCDGVLNGCDGMDVPRFAQQGIAEARKALLDKTPFYYQNCDVLDADISDSYVGDCKEGKAHGRGRASGRDTYVGEFFEGEPHGQGTYTWGADSRWSGHSYTGTFEHGERHGQGKYIADGISYEGEFVAGFLSGMCTRRVPISAFSTESDGEWKGDYYVNKGWCEITNLVATCSTESQCIERLELLEQKICLRVDVLLSYQNAMAEALGKSNQVLSEEYAAYNNIDLYTAYKIPERNKLQNVLQWIIAEKVNEIQPLTMTHWEFLAPYVELTPGRSLELLQLPSLWADYCRALQ